MKPTAIFQAITVERQRQEGFVKSGKFGWTCADRTVSDDRKLSVLVEEVGEVSHELCEQSHDPEWRRKMTTELIQVAAVAVAWLEALP